MESTGPLIPEQRHQRVLQLLRRDGVLSTRALTDHLGVSHMTVRRDIATLEASGQVVSVQGGVRLAGTAGQVPPQERRQRAVLELPRKRAIAAAAAELVTDGMVVYLDAGTTCESVVAYLTGRRDLTVVTNDFYAVTALFDVPDIEVIHTGGAVDKESASSSGRLAAATLSAINLDLFFLSTGAWSVSRGVSAPTLDKVDLKRAAIASATTTVLLADSTKYGTASKFQVAPLDQLDLIITDTELPEDTAKRIEELGVEVRLTSPLSPN